MLNKGNPGGDIGSLPFCLIFVDNSGILGNVEFVIATATIVVTIIGVGVGLATLSVQQSQRVNARIDALTARIDELSERMSALEQRMARLEGYLEGYGARADSAA